VFRGRPECGMRRLGSIGREPECGGECKSVVGRGQSVLVRGQYEAR